MSAPAWTFTFCDMRTGIELAVLPLTRVKYGRSLGGGGQLGAYLHLADDKVRALNPWAATRQRRTAVYVEYGDRCVWGGPVVVRNRSDDSEGITLSAVSWEAWLHRQYLLTDLDVFPAVSLGVAVAQLIARAQWTTNVGFTIDATAVPAGAPTVDPTYIAREVKPILELLENLPVDTGVPMEFRIDCVRDPATGRFAPVLRIGSPRIGRPWETTALTFAYPDGGLLKWSLVEDGSGANNVMPLLGAGSGDAQPFDVLFDTDAGLDEIASGFPTWMADRRDSDTDDIDVAWARGAAAMRAGVAGEYVFDGVQLRPDAYLGRVDPGDDIALEIAHKSLPEWPATVQTITRVLAESVTVGDGGKADQVSVTIGGTP